MLSYSSTSFVVLAMRCTFCLLRLWRVDLTYVKSVVQSLTPPCLRQIGSAMSGRPRRRPSCPRSRRCDSQVSMCYIIPLPEKTFSRCPIRVLKMRSCAEPWICSGVQLVLSGKLSG
ncbi:hypothetical protein B296_00007359 [Ensete ventricosum]|uniref:Uncharacterized protein n=1 Tax=Ensete ventricosum TaxID=4639 RepID=A0A426ZIQ3_ENSVE|nr:hypothetical protein B296_00007359 [Ensete ventricosum]